MIKLLTIGHLGVVFTMFLLLFSACKPAKTGFNYLEKTKTVEEIKGVENKLERLYYLYCGEFSNERQSSTAEDVAYTLRQELLTIPIWPERKGEYWIYTAWIKHGQPEKPLTHGIARLTRENRDTFKLTFHQLPKAEDEAGAYATEWHKERPFEDLRPKDLTQEEGCFNYIVERSENVFEILSTEDCCYYYISDQRQYMCYKAKISLEGINQYTEFLDGERKKTFEFVPPVGFELLRLPKESPTYPQYNRAAVLAPKKKK